ncbi:MAG: hypothetical protein D6691_01395 [Candidatus Hydrogenedentota bacterium]|nr:MAG: hypothetical protein D6691_01395 [Candidatus Hydrogenedentota bacterium]
MNIGDKQTLIKSLWSNNIELFLQRPRTKGQLTFLLWQTNRDRYLNGPRVAGGDCGAHLPAHPSRAMNLAFVT